MKKICSCKIFFLLLTLSFIIIGCKDSSDISVSTNFDHLDEKGLHWGDKLPLEFNTADATIDSYTIKLNDRVYTNQKNIILDSTNTKLGSNYLVLTLQYNGQHKKEIDATFNVFAKNKEKKLNYKMIQEYPHNPELFTQGFVYKNGIITESSGQYGKSKLVRYPLGATTYTQCVNLDPKYFAEGFSILNGKIYMLTYKERTALVYNESDFKFEKVIPFPGVIIEGWGATTIGNEIVVSDSSSELKFFDSNFNLKRKITVVGYDRIYSYVNELEYANGYIYANVFNEDIILVINPKTGEVIAKASFPDLVKHNQTNEEAVLNGIAQIEGNTFLITGKLWPKMYKIEFSL